MKLATISGGIAVVVTNHSAPARFVRGNGDSLLAIDARELEVLRLLSLGLTNRQIADRIYYSVGTVKLVVQCVIEKLGVSDRAQAAEAVRVYLNNLSNRH